MKQKPSSSTNKPSAFLLLGLLSLGASFGLFYLCKTEPESQFPLGKFSAYGLSYIMTVMGCFCLYGFGVSKKWLSDSRLIITILVAIGLSLWDALLVSWVFAYHNASVKVYVAGFAIKTNSSFGQLILLPIVIIFAVFALLAWCEVIRQFFITKRKSHCAPNSL